jgi:hypothetical protein
MMGGGGATSRGGKEQSFFASFCSQKEALSAVILTPE